MMISLPSMLLATTICLGMKLPSTGAFSSSSCLMQPQFSSRARCERLWAKPPPISNFDLEAIEAFEAKMDLEAMDISASTQILDENSDQSDDEQSSNLQDDVHEYTVPQELHNKRIDAVVAALEPELSRSLCGNLILDGNVKVLQAGEFVVMDRKSFKAPKGTTIRITMPKDEKPLEIVAQDLPLNILYEDEHMIILNKAAGMVVHPAAGNWDGTVVNALAYYLANDSPYGSGEFVGSDNALADLSDDPAGADGESISFRPGIVHRLDKGTTGILVVAKTTQALGALSEAFAARTVKKTYLAVTVGNPGKGVVIDKPIGRHPIHRQRMRVVPDPHKRDSSGFAPKDRLATFTSAKTGRRALSYVDTLAFDSKLSLVQVRIETGRTHQIRVHLQDRHTPIYGDDVYGIADWNKRLMKSHGIERPLLHAYRLELNHPVSGERMVFTAPMADDMAKIANLIWPEGKQEISEAFA